MNKNYNTLAASDNSFLRRLSEETAFYMSKARILSKADAIPDELYIENKVKRGLRNANGTGVIVGLTKVGEVVGYRFDEQGNKLATEGKLYYRGYDIEDIVQNLIEEDRFGFEEITYLLLFGELPDAEELRHFNTLLGNKRELPPSFARDMILTAPSKNIMNKLSRSVLAMYSYDDNPDDTSLENILRQCITLIGHFPAFISYGFQARCSFFNHESLHLHTPLPELSTAENILRMIRPTGEYTDLEAKILDLCLVLHAEHGGGNNSTFTTHLISSTGTDTYSAIAAAVGSLKGPKHGGANIAVIDMIENLKANVADVTNEASVEDYLIKVMRKEANDGSGLIYGLGHAIYTISDPRAKLLKIMARKLAKSKGLEDDFALCEFIENRGAALYREITGTDKLMPANVDLYSGFVYRALNIPKEIATPLFATARLSGWSAHRMEELLTGSKLMRPAYTCVEGYHEYVPIKDR